MVTCMILTFWSWWVLFGHGGYFHSLFFSSRLEVSMWLPINFYLLHIYSFPFDSSEVGEAIMGGKQVIYCIHIYLFSSCCNFQPFNLGCFVNRNPKKVLRFYVDTGLSRTQKIKTHATNGPLSKVFAKK